MLADSGRRGKNDKVIYELRPHPVERKVVVRMFEMAEATSQRQIARILNEEGIPSSLGARWAQSTVARVLGSPLYIGKIRRKVAGRWEIYDGQHEPIIDTDLFGRVNKLRADPERRVGGRPMHSQHLLTRGTLRCGSCGSAMFPVFKPGRPDVYACLGRRNHGPGLCAQPQLRRELIDEALLAELTSRYLDLDGARERLRDRQASELPLARAAVQDAEREVAQAEARIAKVIRGWQDEIIGDDEYARQRAQLEEELAGAHEAAVQSRHRVEQIEAAGATTDAEETLLQYLADLKVLVCGTVDRARDVEGLRTVIRQLFASIELIEWPGFGATRQACQTPAIAASIPSDLTPGSGTTSDGWVAPSENVVVEDRGREFGLVLHLRWQMLDGNFEPIRAAVPGLEKVTAPTCR